MPQPSSVKTAEVGSDIENILVASREHSSDRSKVGINRNGLSLEAQGQQGRRIKYYLVLVEFANHFKACTDIFPL
jgi:hypothetical protein